MLDLLKYSKLRGFVLVEIRPGKVCKLLREEVLMVAGLEGLEVHIGRERLFSMVDSFEHFLIVIN